MSVIAEMIALAEHLESIGNHAGAADVRKDVADLSRPRPVAVQYCDACRSRVTSRARIEYYGDVLGVDWVLCAKCEAKP